MYRESCHEPVRYGERQFVTLRNRKYDLRFFCTIQSAFGVGGSMVAGRAFDTGVFETGIFQYGQERLSCNSAAHSVRPFTFPVKEFPVHTFRQSHIGDLHSAAGFEHAMNLRHDR